MLSAKGLPLPSRSQPSADGFGGGDKQKCRWYVSDKGAVGIPLDEVVKDADVLDCHQYGVPLRKDEHQRRLKSLLIEMALSEAKV
jgi:hypothetical protein